MSAHFNTAKESNRLMIVVWVVVVVAVGLLVRDMVSMVVTSLSPQPDRTDVVTGAACYDQETHQPRRYDDVYIDQFSGGTCMSAKEYNALTDVYSQLDEAQLLAQAAKQKDAYDVSLPAYERLLQSKIGTTTDVDAVLSDVVTFYCQAEPKATSQQALWDVTKGVYDRFWQANAKGWPFDYARAVGAFGCSDYIAQDGGDPTPPSPSIWG